MRLTGGHTSVVVRVGDTVRRPARSSSVHELLRSLEAAGFDGAPRFLGLDERGREVLSFVEGDVPQPPYPADVTSDEALVSVARLVRRFHDAAPGWNHNDIAPYNVAYRGATAVGLIDWDEARPGPPAWDLAHVAWQCVPCMDRVTAAAHGFGAPDPARRLRLLCDAYGLEERSGFVAMVSDRIGETASGISARAESGDAVYQRLLRYLPAMAAARSWLATEGERLQAGLA